MGDRGLPVMSAFRESSTYRLFRGALTHTRQVDDGNIEDEMGPTQKVYEGKGWVISECRPLCIDAWPGDAGADAVAVVSNEM